MTFGEVGMEGLTGKANDRMTIGIFPLSLWGKIGTQHHFVADVSIREIYGNVFFASKSCLFAYWL